MLKMIFDFFYNLFPYKNYKNNKIFIVKNGTKKELKRKIKGLNVIFNKKSKNNVLCLHFPISFKDTTIFFNGTDGKMTIKNTPNTINKATFYCSAFSEIFIDENSCMKMPNLVIKVNNNTKECSSKLIIGKFVLIAQDVVIRTSDGHSIFNIGESEPYNAPEDIIIGDNVWIGERSVILKGSAIPNNSIVASCALVNKSFSQENTILAGVPAKIVKENIFWKRTPYGEYMRSLHIKNKINEKEVIIKKLKYKIFKLLNKLFNL